MNSHLAREVKETLAEGDLAGKSESWNSSTARSRGAVIAIYTATGIPELYLDGKTDPAKRHGIHIEV